MHAARQDGAQVLLRTEVAQILRDRGRVRGIRTAAGDEIAAAVVINAAGPRSRQLNELAGVHEEFAITTRPLRQEVHHIAARPGHPLTGLSHVGDSDLGIYFRPEPGGGLLVGGQEPGCDPMQWLADPDDYNPAATGERLRGAGDPAGPAGPGPARPAPAPRHRRGVRRDARTGSRSTTPPRCRAITWPSAPAATSSRTPRSSARS